MNHQTLFSLNIDPEIKSHLSETSKWARFISIAGMVLLLIVAAISIMGVINVADNIANYQTGLPATFKYLMLGITIVSILVSFFPLLFLFRFAGNMKRALVANDQQALAVAFFNVKRFFRYIGIILILVLAIYTIVIVFSIVGFAAFGS
jgi:hypothetical protein